MKDNFLQPLPPAETKAKILSTEENKIKNLENRLMGPSSEGKPPYECKPLKEGEFENLKTKIFGDNALCQSQTQNNNISNHSLKDSNNIQHSSKSKGKNPQKPKKTYIDLLMNKRQREGNLEGENNSFNNNTNQNTNNSNNINTLPSDIFSSKNCTSNNYLFNTPNNNLSGKKKRLIGDYYTKISTPLININNSSNSKLINNTQPMNDKHNNSNETEEIPIYKRKEYITLLNEYNTKNKLLEEKEKENEKLKQKISELEETINQYNEVNKNLEFQIKRFKMDVCTLIKENEEFKRKLLKKSITERQYSIGKITVHKSPHGQLLDYFEDGEEITTINEKLNILKTEKEDLDKQKKKLKSKYKTITNQNEKYSPKSNKAQILGSSPQSLINFGGNGSNLSGMNIIDSDSELQSIISNLELLNFRMNNLIKEETELREKKERIDSEKVSLINDINLLNQESKCSFFLRKEPWPLLAGRYQTISLLGKGGYSEVYKAYDLNNHCYVAIKLHQLSKNWNEEIKDNYIRHTSRENQIHRGFNHPAIVKQYDTIEIDNESFCTVLEYCTGPDLGTYLRKNKNISEKEARIIINQILLGLEYLNKLPQKIIHYDLKPENIIFNNFEVKISDFGLAKIIDTNKDKIQLTSQGVGTYWYLPPECFRENKDIDIDSKVDIWSLGVILYEMIYRRKPFGQNCSQNQLIRDKIMSNANQVEFPAKPIISDECKEFIKGCLESRREERFDVFEALNSKFIKNEKGEKKEKNNQ